MLRMQRSETKGGVVCEVRLHVTLILERGEEEKEQRYLCWGYRELRG